MCNCHLGCISSEYKRFEEGEEIRGTMSSLLFFLCLSVVFEQGYTLCNAIEELDESELPSDYAIDKLPPIIGDDYFYCNNPQTIVYSLGGVIGVEDSGFYTCDPATSRYVSDPPLIFPRATKILCVDREFTTISKCAITTLKGHPDFDEMTKFHFPSSFSCPSGKAVKLQTINDGIKEGNMLSCVNSQWTLDNQFPVPTEPQVECVDLPPTTTTTTTAAPTTTSTSTSTSTSTTTTTPKPTTTTTTTPSTTTSTTTTTTAAPTTTTVRRDQKLLSSHMLDLTVYYNVGLGLHAFCSTPSCLNSIQSNGIGYDTSNAYKYVMGKVVSTDPSIVAAAKDLCPIGWANMRLLGFTKAGQAYVHNLNGEGLIMGYVSIGVGTCGATVKIKKWKSKVNADIIYGIDLEGNSWYSGMVQDGGLPQWYMWPYDY